MGLLLGSILLYQRIPFNLVRDGSFDTSQGWTLTGQMAISGGQLTTGTGGAAGDLAQRTDLPPFDPAGTYEVTYSGNFQGAGLFLGQTTVADHAFLNGEKKVIVTPGGTSTTMRIRHGSAVNGALLDFIQIRRLT